MERLTKFGYVWKKKDSKELLGAKIQVETLEDLKQYEQVPKPKDARGAKPNETRESKDEPLFGAPRKGRVE